MSALTDELQLQQAVAMIARHDFATFSMRACRIVNGEDLKPNWHIRAIAHKLEQVSLGEVKRLLICIPPRCLKSYLASICFPAWLLGGQPTKKIICASYANSLAEDFSIKTRQLMQSPWYRRTFPGTALNPQRIAREFFATTQNGYRIATSVGGTLTGRGGDVLIIDDPLNANETYSEAARMNCLDWFRGTVQTRLNDPKNGAIIVIAQRLHEQDLPGHLLESGDWDSLILPMEIRQDLEADVWRGPIKRTLPAGSLLHPERFGPEELVRLKNEMGEREFEAQFNQAPLPPGGALFKRSWLKRYERVLPLDAYEGVFQSWDTAYAIQESNDFSVCTTWGVIRGECHLLHVHRQRLEFPDLQGVVLQLHRKFQPQVVVVEGIGSGLSLYQNIRREHDASWIRTLKPAGSKVDRASQQTIKFEQGWIYLPTQAPWLEEFEKELLSFPNGKHDDQVDSVVQFLAALATGNLLRGANVHIRVR